MNPETLRDYAKKYSDSTLPMDASQTIVPKAVLRAAADAWEADRQTIVTQAEHYETFKRAKTSYIAALEQRLAEAERACRMLAELELEKDSVGEWPEMMAAYLAAKAALAPDK